MAKVKLCHLTFVGLLSGAVGFLLLMISELNTLKQDMQAANHRLKSGEPEMDYSDLGRIHKTEHSDPTLMIDDSAARALQKRARVLCWVPSIPKQINVKVKAVNDTWFRRCDGHIFFIEGLANKTWDVVSLDVPPGYYNLTTKVVTTLLYLYHFHLDQYDWFLKGDDDAYVVMENLRYILSQYNPRDPVYVGHMYKQFHPQGYMSGGASYIMSREALRRVVEEGYQKRICTTKGRYEDLEVAKCLHLAGVASHNTRDRFGRDTFHPLRPSTHILGPIPKNQLPQDYFTMVSGEECCSQLTVSFHKVDPTLMRIMDHLLYRTSVYGRVLDVPALDRERLVKPGILEGRPDVAPNLDKPKQ